jgi:type VII secretion integral membrane protein EccD
MPTTGLVRVTVAAPARRVELTLPERSPVAELLPALLHHTGESPAGGWVLRLPDGTALGDASTLAAHRVRDGDVLSLVPARIVWPEVEQDVAAAPARGWGPAHTRRAALAAGAVAALLALAAVLVPGPPWPGPAVWALGAAALLVDAGFALARARGDAGSGAVVAAAGLPFAFAGGGLLLAGDRPLTALGAPQLVAAGAALLLAAILALVGVADRLAVFSAGVTAGLFAMLGGGLATVDAFGGTGAAAVVAGAGLAFASLIEPLAERTARLPLPLLPRGPVDLSPHESRHAVYATVVRAEGLSTGFVAGVAAAAAPALVVLVLDGRLPALVLAGVLTAGFALRARLRQVTSQRVAWLVAAGTGAAALALGPLVAAGPLRAAGPALLASAAVVVFAGLRRSARRTSRRRSRWAARFEGVLVLAVVPVVCAVLGLYGRLPS